MTRFWAAKNTYVIYYIFQFRYKISILLWIQLRSSKYVGNKIFKYNIFTKDDIYISKLVLKDVPFDMDI